MFAGFNTGGIAEGKKNNKEGRKTDTLHANVEDKIWIQREALTVPSPVPEWGDAAVPKQLATVSSRPAGDGCTACRLCPQPMPGTQRAAFIKPG